MTTLSRPKVATPDWLLRRGAGFWWASDVDLAEATVSLSSFSGGWSRWDVALLLGAVRKIHVVIRNKRRQSLHQTVEVKTREKKLAVFTKHCGKTPINIVTINYPVAI